VIPAKTAKQLRCSLQG